MLFKLKHGAFEADLNICNRAYLSTLNHTEIEGIGLGETNLANAIFLQTYAYYAYAVNFTRFGSKPPLDILEFDDAISEGEEDSNVQELFTALSESLISKLSKITPSDDKKKGIVTKKEGKPKTD